MASCWTLLVGEVIDWGSDRGYLPYEFKKENPPTFDGEIKRSQDAEAWLLGMNKFFKLHDYSENMKAKINAFNHTILSIQSIL